MKICHICLCGYYNEGYGYQDNFMVQSNVDSGYEVSIITSQFQMGKNGTIEKKEKTDYQIDGAQIFRIPFLTSSELFNNKLRMYRGLYKHLEKVNPDIIFVHGIQFIDFNQIIKYKKTNPDVKIFADNHSSYHNSAKTFLSKNFLHKIIYKRIINKAHPYLEKIFNVTFDCEKLVKELYKIDSKLELLPLCGEYVNDEQIQKFRTEIRNKLEISDNQIIYIHAGKLNKDKKTIETIKVFNEKNTVNKLLLIGSIGKDIEQEFNNLLMNSSNIIYLGWKTSSELIKYLSASDIFIQLGSQSILFQQAISCGNMVIFDDNINTRFLVQYNNGFLVNNIDEFVDLIEKIENKEINYGDKQKASLRLSADKLNYKKQENQYITEKHP